MIACHEFPSASYSHFSDSDENGFMSTDENQSKQEEKSIEVIKLPHITKIDILLQLGVCSLVFLYLNPFDCLDVLMSHPR